MFHRAFRQAAQRSAAYNFNRTAFQPLPMPQIVVPMHMKIAATPVKIVSCLPAEVQQMLMEMMTEEDDELPSESLQPVRYSTWEKLSAV